MEVQDLTKGQKRYLSQFMCGLCENKPLSEEGCGSYGAYFPEAGGPCTKETLNKRRAECLKGYKPRMKRMDKG